MAALFSHALTKTTKLLGLEAVTTGLEATDLLNPVSNEDFINNVENEKEQHVKERLVREECEMKDVFEEQKRNRIAEKVKAFLIAQGVERRFRKNLHTQGVKSEDICISGPCSSFHSFFFFELRKLFGKISNVMPLRCDACQPSFISTLVRTPTFRLEHHQQAWLHSNQGVNRKISVFQLWRGDFESAWHSSQLFDLSVRRMILSPI